MKKKGFLLLLFLIFVSCVPIYGASNIVPNLSSVKIGDTITVTATVTNVAAWGIEIKSSGPVAFVSGTTSSADATENAKNGTKAITAIYKATGVGTATFTLSGDTTAEGDKVATTISNTTSVTITEATTNSNTNNTSSSSNSNANLSKLVPEYEGLSPNFNQDITKYSLTVPSTAVNLGLTVQVAQKGAKYWITGDENLKIGDNTVNITVTAVNGTKKTYTIIVTKAENVEKANAYLSSIVIDGGFSLDPEFSSQVLEYKLEDITNNIDKLDIVAIAKSDKAKVEITGNDKLVSGENIINIKVTAEDGVTTKNYTIKVNKIVEAITVSDPTDDDIVTINQDEQDAYTDLDTTKKSLFNLDENAKRSALDMLLIAIALVEFAQLVYLYIENKKLKKDNFLDHYSKELKNGNNLDSKGDDGKYTETRRRARASVSESLNNIGIPPVNETGIVNDEPSIESIEEETLNSNEDIETQITEENIENYNNFDKDDISKEQDEENL